MSNITVADENIGLDAEVERLAAQPYRRELLPNEDGSWFARIVEFPGCMTEGESPTEAIENLDDAMRSWISVKLEDGESIPPPSTATQYSGKFNVRLTPILHRELAEAAERQNVSLNSFISTSLALHIGHITPTNGTST